MGKGGSNFFCGCHIRMFPFYDSGCDLWSVHLDSIRKIGRLVVGRRANLVTPSRNAILIPLVVPNLEKLSPSEGYLIAKANISTEMRSILCTWFGEFCSCCSLTALPGPAWVLLNWICKQLISSL